MAEEDYPEIQAKAKEEAAEIYWEMRRDCVMTSARTWLRTERKDTGYPAECQARIDQYDLGDHQSGKVRFKDV